MVNAEHMSRFVRSILILLVLAALISSALLASEDMYAERKRFHARVEALIGMDLPSVSQRQVKCAHSLGLSGDWTRDREATVHSLPRQAGIKCFLNKQDRALSIYVCSERSQTGHVFAVIFILQYANSDVLQTVGTVSSMYSGYPEL
jgi:hypothetical protein